MASRFRDHFEGLVSRAARGGGWARSHYRGFSLAEVEEVERIWGRPLPPAYRDFLLVMGRHTSRAFEYVKMSFDGPAALLEFQKHARQLIAECDVDYRIPAGAFFCSNYLDSQLSYFESDTKEDDPRLFDLEIGNPRQPVSESTLCSYVGSIVDR